MLSSVFAFFICILIIQFLVSFLTKTNPQRLHSEASVVSSSPLHDRVQVLRVSGGQRRGFSLHDLHQHRQEVGTLEGVSQGAHLVEEAAQSPAGQHIPGTSVSVLKTAVKKCSVHQSHV